MAQLDALPYRMYLLCHDLGGQWLFDRTRAVFLTRAAALIVLARRDRLGHAARIGELSGRLALVAPGLADAVRVLDRTIVAAQAGTGGS